MAARRDLATLGVFSFFVVCVFSWRFSIIGVHSAVYLALCGLFLLSVAALTVSFLFPKLKSFLFPFSPPALNSPADEAHNRVKQQQARREQQHQHIVKSSAHYESVLKPRQEAVLKKRKEDFYRRTGHTWKLSQGSPLGGEEEIQANTEENDDETPSQRAARKRKQLEIPNQDSVQKELPKEKKIIILPEEPPEHAEGVVKIALRCLSGRMIQRRFFKTCKSSVLLAWLHKSGYSPTLYALYTSFPRRPLITHSDLTLEDVGINKDTALNVGEKDLSTT